LQWLKPESVEVDIVRVEEPEEAGVEQSELDEMWSYVGKKSNPRWLWHAIDRQSGKVLAYVFGRRKDEVFLAPQEATGAIWKQAILYGWLGCL